MSFRDLLSIFLRHCSFALAWLTGFGFIAERLAPGSILPYLNLYWLAVTALIISLLAPKHSTERPGWRAFGLLPIAFLLVAFLFLVTQDIGRSGILLTATAAFLSLAVLWAVAYSRE